MLGVGNIELSLCSGLFFCSLLGLLCGGTIQEFSMYILLVLIGAVAADAGYDHMEADEAAVMEEHQRKILDALGITR